MTGKRKTPIPRSPLPKKTGGAHKSPKDYDRRKWKKDIPPKDERPA